LLRCFIVARFASVFVIVESLRTLLGLRFSVVDVPRMVVIFGIVALRDSAESLVYKGFQRCACCNDVVVMCLIVSIGAGRSVLMRCVAFNLLRCSPCGIRLSAVYTLPVYTIPCRMKVRAGQPAGR